MRTNARKPHVLNVRKASSFTQKLRGLIGTADSNHVGDALHLIGCSGVHTWFMRYDIDIAFLDKDGRAIRVHRSVKPFSVAKGGRRACSTIERKASNAPWPAVGQRVQVIDSAQSEKSPNEKSVRE